MSPQGRPPAGWYPDPERPGQLRHWDGNAWGEQTPATRFPSLSRVWWLIPSGLRVALAVLVALLLVVILIAVIDPDTSAPGEASDSDQTQTTKFNAGEKERERKRAQRACLRSAVEEKESGTVTCGSKQWVVCGENGTFRITDSEGQYKIVCENKQFIGLAWDSDRNHFFRRARYMGRWIGRAATPGHGTRLSRPAPPAPKPAAPVPPPPDPPSSGDDSDDLRYSTDNDHGYTGPRCYEPGGYYFRPC